MHHLSSKGSPSFFRWSKKALVLSIFIPIYLLLGLYGHMHVMGPLKEGMVFQVRKGQGASEIIENLKQKHIIRSPFLFKIYLTLHRKIASLKTGDFLFEPGVSASHVARVLWKGLGLSYRITIPSGLTNQQIIDILDELDFLEKDKFEMPPEGTLFPDTYKLEGGMTYSQFLDIMSHKMTKALEEVWNKRNPNLLLKTPDDLLILASIIEKETYLSAERPRIAGVFLNRLKKGMKLQSDPTTIYGLTEGAGKLGRDLCRKDLKHESYHNTYHIKGLPPTPISNPTLKSLEAVANPLTTKDLFFVADGSGGHVFSEHYHQHLEHIQTAKRRAKERALLACAPKPVGTLNQVVPS